MSMLYILFFDLDVFVSQNSIIVGCFFLNALIAVDVAVIQSRLFLSGKFLNS